MKLIKKLTIIFLQLILSALLAMLLTTVLDMGLYLAGILLRGRYYLMIFSGLTISFWCICFFCQKTKIIVIAFLVVTSILVLLYLGWILFYHWGAYRAVDNGKSAFYSNHKVMLIVPHQDDEVNVLGGVIEEYVTYGSDVYIVFTTNGDNVISAEIRLQEAIVAADCMGVPEDHLIFLGYGDGWSSNGPHIYNTSPGDVRDSYAGKTATYALANHPAYHEGNVYTIENYLTDIMDVILNYRPDVIYCVDYDAHDDHRATSMAFEKVMGQLLKENPDYRPMVFKGYAYSTSWHAAQDFYSINIGATLENLNSPYIYHWEDRVRLPVSAAALSRSLTGSNVFRALAAHASQNAVTQAEGVANGDKVVWFRNTNSLCYDATIKASSGDASFLNNFMLYDNENLSKEPDRIDGIWIPEIDDSEKNFTITFPQSFQVDTIALYDHPYEDHNILNASIELDDGTCIYTGPLDPGGAVNLFTIGQEVQSFTVTILEQEGELAGLGEVEAFRKDTEINGYFLKLTDQDGNFAYDYIINENGTESFSFYTYGNLPKVNSEHYSVTYSNKDCKVTLKEGILTVVCPQ